MAGRENRSESPRHGVICSRGARAGLIAGLMVVASLSLGVGSASADTEPTVTFEGVDTGYRDANVHFKARFPRI